jgi:hypothetical protein
MKRENIFLEACKDINKRKEQLALEESKRIKEYEEKHSTKKFADRINGILESRDFNERYLSRLKESYKDKALATALKGIYIEALEPATLSDDGILLAESMVDNYIKENGGATRILNKVKNNTYFLARLTQIVEDVADDEVEKEKDSDKEEKKDSKKSDDKEEDKSDDKKEDKSKDKEEESDDKDDDVSFKDDDDDVVDASAGDSDSEDDAADDIINGDEDTDDDSDDKEESDDKDDDDEDSKSNGKVFDELDKEEDVKKAVSLIRKRVSDAEETFIKRNTEDKKQINQLLNKISDNIKTVEDIDDKDDGKSKVAEESANVARQKINEITEHRPLSIFEKLTRNLSTSIVRNTVTKEMYMTESGKLDMPAVYESARVMYGFLETLNTLQLEKVDKEYIKEILDNMK